MDAADVQRWSQRLGTPLVFIPPGPFLMGRPLAGFATRFEAPVHEVTLPGYAIGRFPVTNQEYARFIAAGGYDNPAWWEPAGWKAKETANQNWDDPAASGPPWSAPLNWGEPGWDLPDQPVAGLNWHEAAAYCRWLGGESGLQVCLPTEGEWEKAARGADGRLYPWGDEPPTPGRCTFGLDWNAGRPTPVALHSPQGDSPYGCADMVGNISEWTHSPNRPYPFKQERDASMTVIRRGASYSFGAEDMRCTNRFGSNSTVMRERDGHVMRVRCDGMRIAVLGEA